MKLIIGCVSKQCKRKCYNNTFNKSKYNGRNRNITSTTTTDDANRNSNEFE